MMESLKNDCNINCYWGNGSHENSKLKIYPRNADTNSSQTGAEDTVLKIS